MIIDVYRAGVRGIPGGDGVSSRLVMVSNSATKRVAVSDDGGATWSTRDHVGTIAWFALARHAISGRLVATGTSNNLMYSDDGGENWSTLEGAFTTDRIGWNHLDFI